MNTKSRQGLQLLVTDVTKISLLTRVFSRFNLHVLA